jgi:hypothetical protein
MPGVTVQGTFGTGLCGTGTYVLGLRGPRPEPQEADADVWLLLLFFPLVPLARWHVSACTGGADRAEQRFITFTVTSRSRVPLRAALGRAAKATGVAALTALPLAFEVWMSGTPWTLGLVTPTLGWLLKPGLLSLVATVIEAGAFVVAASIPVLVAMHLDGTTPRVPVRSALAAPPT